jgi:guanine deaminase
MRTKNQYALALLAFILVTSSLSATDAFRGAILHFISDPSKDNLNSYEYYEDGLLVVDKGKIISLGSANDLLQHLPLETNLHEYDKNKVIIPGFIDTHIHFPQVDMIASYGEQLLEWLNKYTFPHEQRFFDKEYAKKIAGIFIKELLRNGTTTALVFASASKESVEALFESAQATNMRIISGNALGDRNLPEYLLKELKPTYYETKELIEKWHGNGRILYAITRSTQNDRVIIGRIS